MRGISKSQSKITVFDEFYNCFFRGDFQKECANFIFRSSNLDIYPQKVRRNTPSVSDQKRASKNDTQSTARN